MALTRAAAESAAVAAIGVPTLKAAGMATTTDGTNADLNGPLFDALSYFGLPVADPSNVSDADLGAVIPALFPRFVAYLRISTLDAVLVRLLLKPQSQEWEDYKATYGDLAKQATMLLAGLRLEFVRRYANASGAKVGVMCGRVGNTLATAPYFPPFPPPPYGDGPTPCP